MEQFDDELAALHAVREKHDARAQLVAPLSGRWVVHPDEFSLGTAAGAYAKGLRVEQVMREGSREPLHICAYTDQGEREWRWEGRGDGGVLVETEPGDLGAGSERSGLHDPRLADVMSTLLASGFRPEMYPYSLADLADAALNRLVPACVAEEDGTTFARGRSAFPFHEFEALTSGGPLAHRDATRAVSRLRDRLETCSLIVAERWGRMIILDMDEEIAFHADPSPTGGMVFSPQAHELADWLELTVRELAEGRGQLVVLARAFAEDRALREDADGALVPVRPVTRDPWSLHVADAGALMSWRVRESR